MVDLNLSARTEAISKLAKKAGAKLSLENGEIVRWTKGDKPTEEAIQSEIDAVSYARARKTEYPEIAEQLDKLYHDINAGKLDKTGEWFKAIKKVKDDNPKSS